MQLSSIAQEIEGHCDRCIGFDPPQGPPSAPEPDLTNSGRMLGLIESAPGSRDWALPSRRYQSPGAEIGQGGVPSSERSAAISPSADKHLIELGSAQLHSTTCQRPSRPSRC
jgi:hypothetical protein